MRLYIEIQDGQPINHPYLEDNLTEYYGLNIPAKYVTFIRVPAPELGIYEKNQTVKYELVDGVYTDVWYCDQMNEAERKEVDDLIAAQEEAT